MTIPHKLFPLRLLGVLVCLHSAQTLAADYWVAKTGSDSNACSAANPCLTIQKGVSLLKAGDTLNVKAGTYTDDGGASAYAPKGAFCGWLDSQPASANVCINVNGTATSPIVLQAAAGDEGKVILDAQNNRVGIHLQTSDYIKLRGFTIRNARTEGIASWGQPENAVADVSRLSIGVVVENNAIYNTTGAWGNNTSAIGMWSSKDWIVRNNLIDGVTVDGTKGCGIQSYGVINALVENNKVTNVDYGIYWKDHFVADATTRASVFESEIRYNEINARLQGLHVSIMGSKSEEAGENYFHHNIVYGYGNSNENLAGINVVMDEAYAISGKIRVENNLLDSNNPLAIGIRIDSSKDAQVKGNIIMRQVNDMIFPAKTFAANVTYSDYNVFKPSPTIVADYGSATKNYATLANWTSAVTSSVRSLKVNNPDAHSKTALFSAIVVNADARNYKYTSTSPALKMMPDGSNAGPYQKGTEVIGLLANWPSYTTSTTPTTSVPSAPPTNIQIQLIN